MSQQPSVTSWQTTVQRQVENGLPKGFTLLAAHQSKGSESLYFTVLKEGSFSIYVYHTTRTPTR
ncbi:hypothetical protein AAEZ42_07015 [Limosilactobacillus fermentum]